MSETLYFALGIVIGAGVFLTLNCAIIAFFRRRPMGPEVPYLLGFTGLAAGVAIIVGAPFLPFAAATLVGVIIALILLGAASVIEA